MEKFAHLNADMVSHFAPQPGRKALLPKLNERQQLALMCRMLFHEGWNEHIAGHITWRQEDGSILTNPWELAWDEIAASDVMKLDAQGEIAEGRWNVTPAIGLHIQLHGLRPDINVVIHNHARWSGIWANLQRVPPAYDQTSCMVRGEIALYDEYAGQYESAEATRRAAEALGKAKWALLANHGSLVVAENLRQAHLRVATLEWRCMRAWQAEVAGGGRPMPDSEAAKLGLADDNGYPFLWEAMARRELRRDSGVLN